MQNTEIAKTVMDLRILRTKIDGTKETTDEMLWRVSNYIAKPEEFYDASKGNGPEFARQLYDIQNNQDFFFNSPTYTGADTELGQLSACFVLPVDDALSNRGGTGIYDTLRDQALVHQTGGGTGFDFSRLRPLGAAVRRSQGVASGPISFLKVFNASTDGIKQGGTRRGANMGILRVDHPDILAFLRCKEDVTQITNFNISVAVTDRFMEALASGGVYELVHNNTVYGTISARKVWDILIKSAWATGEPGIVFIDRMNRRNPNNHAETIEATNPCGEQPLPPYGSCNLGSINLGNFVRLPYEDLANIDWGRLAQVVRIAVHALDNVIDMNRFPIPQIREKALWDRRIGLGVMGLAEMLVMLGVPYDSEAALEIVTTVAWFIKQQAVVESCKLADIRGVYSEWHGSKWEQAGLRMRNATLTTVAPTGTISMFAAKPDQPCSGGIEPKFAVVITRNQAGKVMIDVDGQFKKIAEMRGFWTPELVAYLEENGEVQGAPGVPDDVKRLFKTANGEIGPRWHVRMQAAWQGSDNMDVVDQPIDAATSKTINFPNTATVEDVATVYGLAWELGLKGITVYRDGSRFGQVLTAGKKDVKLREDTPAPRLAETNEEVAQVMINAACPIGGKCE